MFEVFFFLQGDFDLLTLLDTFGLSCLTDVALEDVHSPSKEPFEPLEELHFNSHNSLKLILNIFLIMTR